MSDRLRRLIALAAVFARCDAERLVGLVSGAAAANAPAEAAALAARPRGERLAALAAALPPAPSCALRGGVVPHPILLRLAREAAR